MQQIDSPGSPHTASYVAWSPFDHFGIKGVPHEGPAIGEAKWCVPSYSFSMISGAPVVKWTLSPRK